MTCHRGQPGHVGPIDKGAAQAATRQGSSLGFDHPRVHCSPACEANRRQVWKPAIQQAWKPALRGQGQNALQVPLRGRFELNEDYPSLDCKSVSDVSAQKFKLCPCAHPTPRRLTPCLFARSRLKSALSRTKSLEAPAERNLPDPGIRAWALASGCFR